MPCGDLEGWDGVGKEVQDGGDICVQIADSLVVQQKLAQHGKRIARAFLLSRGRLFVSPWTVACQAPLSMEFSRSQLPFPPPGIFSTQGSNSYLLNLLHWQADSTTKPSGKPPKQLYPIKKRKTQVHGDL